MQIGEMKIEDAAKEAAGNWQHFESFSWNGASEIDNPSDWAIIYTHHRDSGLIELSNSEAITKALKPFIGKDIIAEHHHHWATGWIDGYSIRVFRRGKITKAFRAYHQIAQRLADYPLLDEADYSRKEYEATIENLTDASWKLKNEFELPEGWQQSVYDWFSDHDIAIESDDDRGGYPSEDQLRSAFEALFRQIELV